MKEPIWTIEWPTGQNEKKVPRLYWDGSRLLLIHQTQMVLFSQGLPERVVLLSGQSEHLEPFGKGQDGDLFFHESVGDSVRIFYLPEGEAHLAPLQPMLPREHIYSKTFYKTTDGYGWTAQLDTEMSHFENDRGYREIGYRFDRDSSHLTFVDDARRVKEAGQQIGGERIVSIDGKSSPLRFESSKDGVTEQCLNLGLGYHRGQEWPVQAFGSCVSTPARIGYRFGSINRGIFMELFSSGHCTIRVWQWTS